MAIKADIVFERRRPKPWGDEAMRRGRPPKLLAAEVREQLLAAIRAGNYPKQAAEAAGIDRATFYRWLAKGREPAAPREYRDFCDALTRAQAEAEVHAVGVVRDRWPTIGAPRSRIWSAAARAGSAANG